MTLAGQITEHGCSRIPCSVEVLVMIESSGLCSLYIHHPGYEKVFELRHHEFWSSYRLHICTEIQYRTGDHWQTFNKSMTGHGKSVTSD